MVRRCKLLCAQVCQHSPAINTTYTGQLWHYTFILAVNIDSIQLQQLIETLIGYIKISSDPNLGRDKGYQWIEWIQWQCT